MVNGRSVAWWKLSFAIAIGIFGIPFVLAATYKSGVSFLDIFLDGASRIFTTTKLQNPKYMAIFARTLFFFLIYMIVYFPVRNLPFFQNASGNQSGPRNTMAAGIALIFAALSVFTVPDSVILTAQTIWSAIFWTIILLALPAIFVYWGFKNWGKGGTTP